MIFFLSNFLIRSFNFFRIYHTKIPYDEIMYNKIISNEIKICATRNENNTKNENPMAKYHGIFKMKFCSLKNPETFTIIKPTGKDPTIKSIKGKMGS